MKRSKGLLLKRELIAALFIVGWFCFSTARASGPAEEKSVEGRWDITVVVDGKASPSWLEIMHSGSHHLVGQFVGPVGSARPVSKIIMSDGKLRFTIPPQWEKDTSDLYFEALFASDSLVGKMTGADGNVYNWTAHRAPLLIRTVAPVWNKPVQLLQAGSINGWHALGENQWKVEGGVLKSPQSGSNLVTDQAYTDFKLHIEFRCPKGSNSGIYLRGRYEVQIEDSKGKEPQKDLLGAVYGFLTPNQMAAKSADEWQTFDIVLVGRLVTITANGKEIICRQNIPGITGGALDSNEEMPGPLLLQGDHGPIEYRNIIITTGK